MSRQRTSTPPQIIAEASDWLVAMREQSVSSEDREAFAEWLRASPAHIGAYLEVAKLWIDAAHLDHDVPALLSQVPLQNVVQLRENDEHSGPPNAALGSAPTPFRWRGGRRRVPLLAVTALVMLTVAGSFLAWRYYTANTYTTDIGEQRVLTLEDSSVVRLNARSRLKVRMTQEERWIELSAGQALFDVARDARRPFIVRSGNVSIRAVGTQFDVNQKLSGTIVTVVEGQVKVDAVPSRDISLFFSTSSSTRAESGAGSAVPAGPSAATRGADSAENESEALLVSAGEQVRVARDGAMHHAERADAQAAISWLQQELRFDRTPLSDVLEEFNRYARVPIVLIDPALKTLRINAVFHTTSPESLLHYLAGLEGVRVERSDTEIRISKHQ